MLQPHQQFERIMEACLKLCKTREARSCIENMQFYPGIVEPGYDDRPAALGNWNEITKYHPEENRFETLDDAPCRAYKLLEAAGINCEWEDEWVGCGECGKLFRCQSNCYGWQMAGVISDGECCCNNCIEPASHLEGLEGKERNCNTIESIRPGDHSYLLICNDFEHGFHPGQDASPPAIAKLLRKVGCKRFLFNLDSTGQFNIRFSVWLHEEEKELLETAQRALSTGQTDGPSVSAALDRSLRAASQKMAELPEGEGIKYARCNPDGTADVQLVSPEEFIRGIGKDPKPEEGA